MRLTQQADKPLMIVGHLPHLNRLSSLLILGDQDKEVIRFTMGGIVYLSQMDDKWSMEWAVIPKVIHK